MGTIFALTYTILTMGYSEVQLYHIWEVKWRREFKEFLIENWNRMLDDYKTQLDREKVQPLKLIDAINSINEAIQFTIE